MQWFADHPEKLAEMHWRDFEHLVAELFARDGFHVTLTSQSGDRGVDLYAARQTGLGTLLYVVECKRFASGRAVGPGLVRELRGVIDRETATGGVLVTTSFFSRGAREEQRSIASRLSLRDQKDISHWLSGSRVFL